MNFIHKGQLKSNKQWETNSLLNTMLAKECEGQKELWNFLFFYKQFFK
jgi:hypothetical protein